MATVFVLARSPSVRRVPWLDPTHPPRLNSEKASMTSPRAGTSHARRLAAVLGAAALAAATVPPRRPRPTRPLRTACRERTAGRRRPAIRRGHPVHGLEHLLRPRRADRGTRSGASPTTWSSSGLRDGRLRHRLARRRLAGRHPARRPGPASPPTPAAFPSGIPALVDVLHAARPQGRHLHRRRRLRRRQELRARQRRPLPAGRRPVRRLEDRRRQGRLPLRHRREARPGPRVQGVQRRRSPRPAARCCSTCATR